MGTSFVVLAFGVTAAAVALVFVGVEWARRLSRTTLNSLAVLALSAFALSCWLRSPTWLGSDATLIAVAALAGTVVGKFLRSEGALVAFVVTGAIVDAISTSGGLTSVLVQRYVAGTSLLFQYLSISIPSSGKVQPIVGIGDLFFTGVVMFALARLGHSKAARLLVPLGGLELALTLAFLTRFIAALPALALVTIGYLVVRRSVLARVEHPGPLDRSGPKP